MISKKNFSNQVKAINVTSSSINSGILSTDFVKTAGISDLRQLGINNNYPQHTLDVRGDINFTGSLLQDGLPYKAEDFYWKYTFDDGITNSNIGNVEIGSSYNSKSNLFVKNSLLVDGQTVISNTVDSTNTSSGALVIEGGVGIKKSVNIGTTLNVGTDAFISRFLSTKAGFLTETSNFPVYSSNSIVPKIYVDKLFSSVVSGIVPLEPCACASFPTNISGNYNGFDQISNVSITSIDGYTVLDGDRILLAGQTQGIQNGIYLYSSASNTLTRTTDLDYGSSATGITTYIKNGISNGKYTWFQTVNPATTGTTSLNFIQYTTTDFNINNTLQFVGNTLGVNPDLEINSLVLSGNQNIDGTLFIGGQTYITNTTNSESISSGALIVQGGIGIGGAMNIGGQLNIINNNSSISTTTGALVIEGGVGIGESINVGNEVIVNNTLFTKIGYLTDTSNNPIYSSNSIVPKSYVDSLFNSIATGIYPKAPCSCISTSNVSGNYNGTTTITGVTIKIIDGYTLQVGDRVLLSAQTVSIQNGIYDYSFDSITSTYTLTRSSDLAYGSDASGITTYISYGNEYSRSTWFQNVNPATTGVQVLNFIIFNSAGFNINSTLQFVGNTLGVNPNLEITSLKLSGDEIVGGNLDVGGQANIGTNIVVGGNSNVQGNASIVGNTNIVGQTTITNTLNSESSSTGALIVSGGVGIMKNLNVSGTTNLSNSTIDSLIVTNNQTIGGELTVVGNTTLSTLSTSGLATLSSATVTGNASVGGILGVTGNTTLTTLTTSGLATINSTSVIANASVGGILEVTGNTTLSTLSTSGLASLDSTNVTNDASVGGTLEVTGNTTLSTLTTTGLATIESTSVTNDASVGGTLTVSSSGIKFSDDTVQTTAYTGGGNVPIGGIIMWSGATAPTNWGICDGSTYGSIVSPNLSGRFILGSGTTSGTSNNYSVGQADGQSQVTLSVSEIPAHTHTAQVTLTDPGHIHQTTAGPVENTTQDTGETDYVSYGNYDTEPATTQITVEVTNQNTGEGNSHNNMPPYYVLAYIIRYQ